MSWVSKAFRFLNVGGTMIAALFLLSFIVLLPSAAGAQCAQWNVSGKWSIQQGETVVNFDLTQNGNVVSGTGAYTVPDRKTKFLGITTYTSEYVNHNGDVDGTVNGNAFAVHIYWDRRMVGVYEGTISPGGRVEGTAYDKARPGAKVQWYSKQSLICPVVPKAAPTVTKTIKTTGRPRVDPPPPPAKTIKTTGRPKITPDTTGGTTTAGAPQISARPNNAAFIPGQVAHTVIIWDGGPDHPYAELWVRVNDGDETKIIEQGKGTRQVVVEPGKTYLYILTDAGQTLATVTVKFH